MKKTLTLALAVVGALSVSACQTPQQQTGTLAGGAIGAGGGALIGSALTHGSAGVAIAGAARDGAGTATATASAAPGTDRSTLHAPWLVLAMARFPHALRPGSATGMTRRIRPDTPLAARFLPSPNFGERRGYGQP